MNQRTTPEGEVTAIPKGWRLSLTPGDKGRYRLAQIDDYSGLRRHAFPHQPPFKMSLQARASQPELPGTWGFGLWNDPFGLSLGFGGTAGRLPALPDAAWFFFASPHNHLSLGDGPGNGNLVGGYQAARIPSLLLAPALLVAPLLAIRPISRGLRRFTNRLVQQNLKHIPFDPSQWHSYEMSWSEGLQFTIDGEQVFATKLSPQGPLGLVVWLDNQYAAWRPDGRLSYGTLATPSDCWVEITDLQLG